MSRVQGGKKVAIVAAVTTADITTGMGRMAATNMPDGKAFTRER